MTITKGRIEKAHATLGGDWRERITENLKNASAQRLRMLFHEINPHLVGEKAFESRWSNERRDAAVLVPIIDRRDGPTVLLTVRSSDMPSHAGQISFPGGRLHEDDPSAVAAALRETEEEVNIPTDAVDVIGVLGVHEGGIGYSVTPVIGIVNPNAPIKACPREVAEIFEAPLAHFVNLNNHYTEERELKGIKYNMFAAPYGDYHIWGLTAAILRTIAEMLQE